MHTATVLPDIILQHAAKEFLTMMENYLKILKARSIFWPTPAVFFSAVANASIAPARSPVHADKSSSP
jgi:hypothetical protein